MVDRALTSLAGSMSSPAREEFCLLWSLEDEVERLKGTFSTIQDLLEDHESEQHKSMEIQNWLMKLKYAAYDAENILEEVEIQSLAGGTVDSERCECASFLQFFYSLLFRFRMAHKVKNLRKRLDAIAEDRQRFHLSVAGGNHRYGVTLESRETCSVVIESEICGRQEEKEMIIGKLCDKRLEKDNLSVYAIWGMGGLGKTTLAQLVLNDKRIQEHFYFKMWVCVSNNFDVKILLKAMIESIDRSEGNVSKNFDRLDALQSHLREKLIGKKFLLVLDDAWNVDREKWESLRVILRCDSKGSAVIVTTRIKTTATMMAGTNNVHDIGILSEADSWSLFKQRAFPNGEENEERLVQIGEAIVRKCRGVPLVIKAIASLMRSKSGESEWLDVERSEIWTVLVNENEYGGILLALKLSYYNLPRYMRQCFAYCCIFPKDEVMEVDQLIQLWMANGFIRPSNSQRDLPREGKKIFQELTWRCFFEDHGTNDEGKRVCKMHDLMHDLALSVMGQEASCCTLEIDNDSELEIPEGLRHAGYFNWELSNAYKNRMEISVGNSLCSFIAPSLGRVESEDFYTFLSKQQYLRALDIRRSSIGNLDLVCKLQHLKFLVMNCDGMETLPGSLTHLRNLQTLQLMNSIDLRELPKELKVMKKLCFLKMDNSWSLDSTPPELGKLRWLCELSDYVVGEDALQQIEQLTELKLGGELRIKGLENVKSLEDAKSARLMTKEDLTHLKLSWSYLGEASEQHYEVEEVLQGLQPHHNIQRLSIEWYTGSKFPEWMSSSDYIKLKEVELQNCRQCEHLPALGKLPSLTELTIDRLDWVKSIGAEWYGDGDGKCSFPALTTLKLHYMGNLEEWSTPDSVESFPRLTQLDISDCPKLDSFPSLPCLTELNILSCPKLNSLPSLPSLRELRIDWPTKSPPNMLDNLSGLKTLIFFGCDGLAFIPEGVVSCLNSLERLEFDSCRSLKTFPVTILEGLPSLSFLRFDSCGELEHLLSGSLNVAAPALHHLQIEYLRKLQCLPESLTTLNSLRKLEINHCPLVEKRCEKPNGEDWPKISHIPTIEINWRVIQEPGVN